MPATSSPGKSKGKRDFPRILCKLQSKDIKYYFVYGLNNYNFDNTYPDHVLEKRQLGFYDAMWRNGSEVDLSASEETPETTKAGVGVLGWEGGGGG